MATRQEAREHIIDLILNFIVTNAEDTNGFGIDLSSYRRYIENHFRKEFGFDGTPVVMNFNSRTK